MNFKKLYQLVCKEWSNLTFEVDKETSSSISFNAELSIDGYDDDILLNVTADDDLLISFTFDSIEPTLANFELINDYNANANTFKAYIMKGKSDNYFALEYYYEVFGKASEKEFAEVISAALLALVADSTKQELAPILANTH